MEDGKANKKRKQSNNKNNNKRSRKRSKPNANNSNRKKKNWIESCTDSFHRIPAESVAPLTCCISRVELQEEPLVPLLRVENKDTSTVNSSDVDEKKLNNDDGNDDVKESTTTTNHGSLDTTVQTLPQHDKLSTQIIATLKTKHVFDATTSTPFQVSNTITVDGIEKKVFIPVKRVESAVGPTLWQQLKKHISKSSQQRNNNYQHLPNGNNGDGILNPHPKHLVPDKYWAQRKRLFTKYDEGIQIEHGEMWYSITPECIAVHVASRVVDAIQSCKKREEDGDDTARNCMVVIDAFCGCGGNTIAFGLKDNVKVIAVDNDLNRLRMAANNAKVYGVHPENVVFVHADVLDVLCSYRKGVRCMKLQDGTTDELSCGYRIGGLELLPGSIDAIFLSPPWGGMDYNNDTFHPNSCIGIESHCNDGDDVLITNGGQLFQMTAKAAFTDSKEGVVAYFLPRNVDGIALGQIAVASGIEHDKYELEQNVVNGKVKTVTAYFGHSFESSTLNNLNAV